MTRDDALAYANAMIEADELTEEQIAAYEALAASEYTIFKQYPNSGRWYWTGPAGINAEGKYLKRDAVFAWAKSRGWIK